jgi:hypothetical protein
VRLLQEEPELHAKQILHAYGCVPELLVKRGSELQRMQKADQRDRRTIRLLRDGSDFCMWTVADESC